METCASAPTAAEIHRLARRFASLRAAQRALSASAHPSELERAVEQGRELLILLQDLSIRAVSADDEPAPGEQSERDRAELRQVDQKLDEISQRIRELLDDPQVWQLRADLPTLAAEHPEEVRGLIDAILEGEVGRDKSLRLLEYLVTLLCSENREGRRAMVRQPGEAAPQLRELAEALLDESDPECLVAEQRFSAAALNLCQEQDVGETRDRIRRYKEELGSRILHPRVLSAAVAYNIAMGNRLAGLIEGSRAMDVLADDLLAPTAPEPLAAPVQSLFESSGFLGIVSALRSRLTQQTLDDDGPAGIAGGYELGGLLPVEIEAFEAPDEDRPALLVRAGVALGLTIGRQPEIDAQLREIGIEPQLVGAQWLDELAREMTATAQKLFSEGRYGEATRLSEAKRRNLSCAGAASEQRDPRPGAAAAARSAAVKGTARDSGLHWYLATLGFAVALLALTVLLWPTDGAIRILSSNDLSRISPYLQSGYSSEEGGFSQFVGTLNHAWDRLETEDRRAEATSIGSTFRKTGIGSVVLIDRYQRMQVRYRDGAAVHVAPKPTAEPAPSASRRPGGFR
jgi:hypothetical protein